MEKELMNMNRGVAVRDMDKNQAAKHIWNLFVRVGKQDSKYRTNDEHYEAGIRIFERKLLGFFRFDAVKSLDDIGEALYVVKMTSFPKDARNFAQDIAFLSNKYDFNVRTSEENYMKFKEVNDATNDVAYKVSSYGAIKLF